MQEFIELLNDFKIKVLVDVRRFPTSRIVPQFNKDNLEKELKKHGIMYVWLGTYLGGYRVKGYINYMKTPQFNEGLQKLIQIIEQAQGNVAIMCSEKLWFRCHRRFIANKLVEMGYQVYHITDKKKGYLHKLRPITNYSKRT